MIFVRETLRCALRETAGDFGGHCLPDWAEFRFGKCDAESPLLHGLTIFQDGLFAVLIFLGLRLERVSPHNAPDACSNLSWHLVFLWLLVVEFDTRPGRSTPL